MLGREMEMQVPHSAFDVSAITAAPKFLHGPVKTFCTEPTALAAVRSIPGTDGPEGGRPGLHHPKQDSPSLSKRMLHQLTTSPRHYQ